MIEIKESFTTTAWFDDDPRFHINKRSMIIVLQSNFSKRMLGDYPMQAIVASVETKNGWSIWFSKVDRKRDLPEGIFENEDWPKGWIWAYLPQRSK